MAKNKTKKIQFKERRIIFTVLATVGVVAVWRGIWLTFDSISYFNNPIVAGGLAILVLLIAAVYFKKINFF